jgi:branched-chain amino acid aminotransferase
MPCTIRVLTPEGVLPGSYHADSLADAIRMEPQDGVYTVANTFNTTQTLKLDAHLSRLEDSAQRAGILLRLDRPRLRATLRQMIVDAGYGDVRFRITVPRDHPDHFILSIEPFKPLPEQLITEGVRCITVPNSARHDAAVKNTAWMHQRQQIAESLPDGIYDAILLDAAGYMMEGLAANFYAVRDGILHTAGTGVLPGIAQQIVFAVAPVVLPVQTDAVNVRDVPHLQEAFITSSSRGIIPVVEIDGHLMGDGTPGPHTLRLRMHYGTWVEQHLEEL